VRFLRKQNDLFIYPLLFSNNQEWLITLNNYRLGLKTAVGNTCNKFCFEKNNNKKNKNMIWWPDSTSGISLRARQQANWTILPLWFDYLKESFHHEEVQFKKFCLHEKTNCLPSENLSGTPTVHPDQNVQGVPSLWECLVLYPLGVMIKINHHPPCAQRSKLWKESCLTTRFSQPFFMTS